MTIKVAAIQMVSTTSPETNMASAQHLLEQAATQGAQWALLPEYWPIMGRKDTDKLAIAEVFGESRGVSSWQAGWRHWLISDRFQLDATVGSVFGQLQSQRWFTLGLRILFPPN